MFCPSCGKEIPDDSSYCLACGKSTGMALSAKNLTQEFKDELARLKHEELQQEAQRRRYQEIYDFHQKEEARGRDMRMFSPLYGLVVGLFGWWLVDRVSHQYYPGALPTLSIKLVAGLLGIIVWLYIRSRAIRMIVEAQVALVAVDTEQNTRQTVELLKRFAPGSPVAEVDEEDETNSQ